jgi:hypothetical protein
MFYKIRPRCQCYKTFCLFELIQQENKLERLSWLSLLAYSNILRVRPGAYPTGKHMKGAPTLLTHNYYTRLKMFAIGKCSSLFPLFTNDKEKQNYKTYTSCVDVMKLFLFLVGSTAK